MSDQPVRLLWTLDDRLKLYTLSAGWITVDWAWIMATLRVDRPWALTIETDDTEHACAECGHVKDTADQARACCAGYGTDCEQCHTQAEIDYEERQAS